jgi:hypothetical protein
VLASTFGTVIWFLGGVVIFIVVWKVGIGLLRSMTSPLPPPPPAGELRKVNLRFRCSTCGVELRLVVAPDEDPVPPRHCMDEMDLIAPPIE